MNGKYDKCSKNKKLSRFVFGDQSVLFVSTKPKAFKNNLEIRSVGCHFSNQNIVSVFYRFTRIIVEKVLTNQSAWFPSCVKKLRIIKSSTFQPNALTNPNLITHEELLSHLCTHNFITYKALLYNFQFLGISPQTNNNKNVVEWQRNQRASSDL